jgi:hypothetical protein
MGLLQLKLALHNIDHYVSRLSCHRNMFSRQANNATTRIPSGTSSNASLYTICYHVFPGVAVDETVSSDLEVS